MDLNKELDGIESFEDLFMLTIKIAKSTTNVATLAYVESKEQVNNGKYYEVMCSPFPLKQDQSKYTIKCYCNNDLAEDLSEKDIVIILYTDLDFRRSLNNNSIDPVSNEECHSINTGVIINYLYKSSNE